MASTKKRAYLAIIILGALALAVDRLVLSGDGSSPAVAIASDPPSGPAGSHAPPDVSPDGLMIPEIPFPRGLAPLAPDATVRDLFAEPGGIDGADNALAAGKASAERLGADPATFASSHRLQAVMVSAGQGIAIVSGVWIRVGESVDGCTMTAIEGRKVRFDCADGEVILEIAPSATTHND